MKLIERVAAVAGVATPRMSVLPTWALKAVGAAHRGTKELMETSYMFERPFVVDSTTSQARLGLAPTPLEAGLAQTVAWWRENGT